MWRKHISRTKKDCQLWTKKNQRRSSQTHTHSQTHNSDPFSLLYIVYFHQKPSEMQRRSQIRFESLWRMIWEPRKSRRKSSSIVVCLWLDSGAKCPANRISTPSRQQRRSTTCLKPWLILDFGVQRKCLQNWMQLGRARSWDWISDCGALPNLK